MHTGTAVAGSSRPVATDACSSEVCASDGCASDGWIEVGPAALLHTDDVISFDHGDRTFAIYRLGDGRVFATDGLCTHAQVHLCDGLVRDGVIECPKHNGRFEIDTGRAVGRPAKIDLVVHAARELDGRIEIQLSAAIPSERERPPIATR